MTQKNKTIPTICIGTWALGGGYWGKQNHSDSIKTIHAANREGFYFFDTSPVYGKGRSEQLLGQQLCKEKNIIISTKSFIKPIRGVEKSFNNSLRRLNRDYIDYFFVHWPSTKDDCRPMIELLEKLRSQGKIRNIGLSNFNITELKTAREAGHIDIIQNAYNFFWNKEKDYFKQCQEMGIITQVYSPLAQGILSGKFTWENPYIPTDLRYKMSLFSDNNLKIIYDFIPKLSSIAKDNNITIHNLILKWTISHSFIDSMVIGCRTRKQVEELRPLNKLNLKRSTLKRLNILSQEASEKISGENNIFNHSY